MSTTVDEREQQALLPESTGTSPAQSTNAGYGVLQDEERQASEHQDNGQPKSRDLKGDDSAAPKYSWLVVVMIASSWIGCFWASIDSSVIATLTGPISESFGSFQLMSWFINSYLIASATIQPLSGKLSDIYGRRAGLLWANFLFLVGNLICGFAKADWHFIVGRVMAGLGGGCIHSISTFLMSDLIPLRSRGFWQGLSNLFYGVGFALGGAFGGFINDRLGWRWAFWIQPIPIALSMVLLFVFLKDADRELVPSFKRIDFLGSATLALSIILFMFGAISGGNVLPWSSPFVLVPLILSPVFLLAFGYVEQKIAREPVIPIHLLKNRTVLGSCLTCLANMSGAIVMVYYVPLFLQVNGLTPTEAGLRLVPHAVGVSFGSLGTGALMNMTGKYSFLLVTTQVCVVAASGMMLFFHDFSPKGALPFVVMFLNGTGLGGMLVATLLALISAADHQYHAVLTSASYAFRSTGQILGVTIAGALFQNVFNEQLWHRFGDREDAGWRIPLVRSRLGEINRLPSSWKEGVLASYSSSFNAVWTFALLAFLVGAISVLVVRENRLHKTLNRN